MSEKNVLILQSNVVLKNCELNELYDTILAQKERGVILLPSYVKVVNIPEEVINGELVVTNSGAPEPEKYVIKRNQEGWNYVLNIRPSYGRALLVDYTDYKMMAMQLNKTEAEKLLKKLGNGYEMEEL